MLFLQRERTFRKGLSKTEEEEGERISKNGESSKLKRTFPPCGHCGLTNHSTERCYRNPENSQNRRETNNDDQPSTSGGGSATMNSGVDKNVLNNPLHLN